MKIAIASDHAALILKEELYEWLTELAYEMKDFGTYSDSPADYPDFAFPAAESVANGENHLGILICGTGTGMCISANKVTGVRAANCLTPQMAMLARSHNNANILNLGARLINTEEAKLIVMAFLNTEFDGGRHEIRINKILTYEQKNN